MRSRKRLLKDSRLYVVIDSDACGLRSPVSIALAAARAGAGVVQLRDKTSSHRVVVETAMALRRALISTNTLFIVNDYLDIARIVQSDGVHLGQSDGTVAVARAVLGKDRVIGISCTSVMQAVAAERGGADYVGLGAIFPTPTKPSAHPLGTGSLTAACSRIRIPVFAIGGINRHTLSRVRLKGTGRIAVCSAICKARDPFRAAASLLMALH